jgi:2,3-bisphosphoglycerate-independent phosphoglycerate mutase
MEHKQIILVILDGWGHRPEKEHNAIAEAKTPFFDQLWENYPHGLLEASGLAVGLPEGQIGNSEVGHMTIGTGKAMDTDLVRISKAVKNNELASNPVLLEAFEHAKKYNSTLHLQGQVGPGGVHSHQEHLHGLLRAAKQVGLEKVVIHAFTDGRDLPPQSAHKYLEELEDLIEKEGIGYIATAVGRFYAMDRDNNWDRIKKAELALFEGKGAKRQSRKPSEVLAELHKEGVVDEHLEPVIFLDNQAKAYPISKNDAVIFFNFRPDRARQLAKRVIERKIDLNLFFATLTDYDNAMTEARVLFPFKKSKISLAGQIAAAGLTQAHIAETEKYAHVTYFLNGGQEVPYENEERVLIDSRRDIRTHDEVPEMRAAEITDAAIGSMSQGKDFLAINYANADMVGHTANAPATVRAIEFLDSQLKRLIETAEVNGYTVVITADHGNAELNFEKEANHKHTAHTTNVVPVIVTDKNLKIRPAGTLADVAPTILEILELQLPKEMTGNSLLIK